jgi:tetratricopeptide (TPR) repeat protein
MLEFPLHSRLRRTVFVAGVFAFGLLLLARMTRLSVARQWINEDDPDLAARAARLDPGNALMQNRLGFLLLRESSDVSSALPHLRRATELNPLMAVYQSDLGSGCEMAGMPDCAHDADERAASLAPMRPEFTWLLANYNLRAGDNEGALRGFARYLHLAPGEREQVFALLHRGIGDAGLVWRSVVRTSGSPLIELSYLEFLERQAPQTATAAFWQELVAEGKPLPLSAALPWVDKLLDNGKYDEARRAWSDLQTSGVLTGGREDNNLVFNGSFRGKLLDGGLDWHLHREPFVEAEVAQPGSCRNGNCLHISFSVPHNADSEPAYQIVPVEPERSYSLSAFVRSQEITSDSGPRLRVVDPQCPDCLDAATAPALQTTPWHKMETTFTTGPRTRAVKLSVWRPRSRAFPMDIGGEFWLDSVSLTPASRENTSAP